jgi:hypothetical protein
VIFAAYGALAGPDVFPDAVLAAPLLRLVAVVDAALVGGPAGDHPEAVDVGLDGPLGLPGLGALVPDVAGDHVNLLRERVQLGPLGVVEEHRQVGVARPVHAQLAQGRDLLVGPALLIVADGELGRLGPLDLAHATPSLTISSRRVLPLTVYFAASSGSSVCRSFCRKVVWLTCFQCRIGLRPP